MRSRRPAGERGPLAAAACALRARRADEHGCAYDRGVELKEGLAQYVQHRALAGVGDEAAAARVPLPADGFEAEDLRGRGYATGEAWALLLDRFAPGWREALESGPTRPLDELLAEALEGVEPAGLDEATRERLNAAARTDAQDVRAARAEALRAFEQAPGWSLEVHSAAPLFPQGFDPMNVRPVGEGRVLHTRWVLLGNQRGQVEVLDRTALTEPVGEHPLYNGVRVLRVSGLADEPRARREGDTLHVEGPGITLSLRGAEETRDGAKGLLMVRVP